MKWHRNCPPGQPAGTGGLEAVPDPASPLANGQAGFLRTGWNWSWLLAWLLVCGTILAYLPVWHAGFIWDDDSFLVDNPLIKAADGLYRIWFTAEAGDYVPATATTLWLEWRLWGTNALGYHLVNVLLHALNALILWRVLSRLKIPGAWLAAAIFALHPVNVESVAWITERKNTLALFFCAGALLGYLRFDDTGGRRWYWLGLGAFVLALLSKPAVAPLPVVLLGLAWWRRGQVNGRDLLRSLGFFLASAASAVVAVWVQYSLNHGGAVRSDILWSRLAGAGWAVWFYLCKAVLPFNLVFVYPRWQIDSRQALSYVPGLLVVAGFLVCWGFRRQWGRATLFGLGYFVVMLLPVLGFLNIYFMRYSLVADHWQYFAIIGPLALAAAFITRALGWTEGLGDGGIHAKVQGATRLPLIPYPLAQWVVCGAILAGLGVLTWRQCGTYHDVETLWRRTLATNPGCWMASYNLGVFFGSKGQTGQAIHQYHEALRLKPDFAEASYNLGVILGESGQTDNAIRHFQHALRFKPDYADAHYNLGVALGLKGQTDEAISHFQEAIRLKPSRAEDCINLGAALDNKGQTNEALRQLREAIHVKLDHADAHYNLGTVLANQGQTDEAMRQFQEALRLKPDYAGAGNNRRNLLAESPLALGARASTLDSHGKYAEAIQLYQAALKAQPDQEGVLNNLAWLLATCPDAAFRNGPEAVRLASRACERTGYTQPLLIGTLAAAQAEAGDFAAAIATGERAAALAADLRQEAVAAKNRELLQLYRRGQAFHEQREGK